MKKSLLAFLISITLGGSAYSQQVISSSGTSGSQAADFNNEIKLNFLNLIVLGSFELGYERFLSNNHSLDLQVHINDRFGYNSQNDNKTYKTNAVQAGMNFYFGDSPQGRFHVFPFLKYRFGEFEETVSGDAVVTDMSAFILGAGIGYKWEVSDHFAFGPYASIARNFSQDVSDRFASIETNAGFSLGYRF